MKDPEHIKATENIKGIFDSYYQVMVVFANNYLNDTQECEDVVQNALMQLWESDLIFPSEVALRSYLYKVVKNRCYNIIKHHKVKEKFQIQNKITEETVHHLDDKLLVLESARILHESIKTLAPRKKQIIELALKGASNIDIAENLGIKLETVKSLKSKAYKVLRLLLDNKI